MNTSFKDHKFSEDEKLWMKEVHETSDFDTKIAKVKLWEKLPKNFNPKNIDSRFLIDGENLTLLGIWHIDPKSSLFEKLEKVIIGIRDIIIEMPGLVQISSENISTKTGLKIQDVEIALYNLQLLGRFYSSSQKAQDSAGINLIGLSGDDAYDPYLAFETIEQLLEDTYVRYGNAREQQYKYVTLPAYSSWVAGNPSYAKFESDVSTENEDKKDTAFVLMAMDPNIYELEDVYHTIKDVCASFGINAYRADEIEHQDRITDMILSEIESCEFLIADLSYERPNVYYEIGYAHALDKRPILYRRTGTRLHFDLAVHNVPEYKNVTELKELLNKRFEAILGRAAK